MAKKTLDKEIILILPNEKSIASEIVKTALENNIKSFLCDPKLIDDDTRSKVRVFSLSNEGDVVLIDSLNRVEDVKKSGKEFALIVRITKKADEDVVMDASQKGAMSVFIETEDWKIIPLENLVAQLHKKNTKLYTKIESLEEVQTMFGVLELGVDGVIYAPKSPDDIKSLIGYLSAPKRLELTFVKIKEVKDVGMGDRVCIDTASMLEIGDGALIGSQSNLFFLIHSETIGSDFTAPRPFRVNAGAVHSYILLPDARTKYLSEIEAGDEVLIVNSQGITKSAIVGRAKIERRPLRLIRATYNGRIASILVQNAETIRLVGKNNKLISATEIKLGDEVLAYAHAPSGRHFGIQVDEHIIEK
ncbi:MAG: 3-dehydroquinate synthase [archaeon]|nr:3-dehydroquinate synthase [archaeon]MCP8313951.1 3-dehydroquinate synthase [archaeon]MCP8317146.1 3-dehydroquinate synthase [archaeon]